MNARPHRLFSARASQGVARALLWAMTALAIAILIGILAFVLARGLPHIGFRFLTGSPSDGGETGGILPIIVGTLEVTLLGVLTSAPLGVATAVYLVEYTTEGRWIRVIRFGADCLAGVPSILFGLFGFVLFVLTLGMGWSILAGGLTLAFMTLPTIIRTSEEAIRSVPAAHRDVSLSLGATRWQTIWNVVLPGALPGILTGMILGLGRAIGETAALIFTAGSSLPRRIPDSLFDGTRTLSVHFYQLAREAISADNAYATAAVLVVAIASINMLAHLAMHRFMRRYR